MKLCACPDHEEFTPKNLNTRYIVGHNTKGKEILSRRVPRYTKICQCGCDEEIISKSPNRKFIHGHNAKFLNKGIKRTPEQRKKLSDAHKPYWTPERRAKKSEITKKLWANGVYSENSSRHSSHEYRLKPLLEQLGYKSTIDTVKFITFNGKTREPDFFNPVTRDIIEIFGSYHHRDQKGKIHETPEEYIEWYAQADYNCRVIWDYELGEFENEILNLINQRECAN